MTAVPSSLLRPALELAVKVAREGEMADPTEPAPLALRRYLRFAKLPAPALDIARKVVDEDDEFRARVLRYASAEQVGEAGWLWLTRTDGWEARLEDLRRQSQEAEMSARENRAERDARRRLAGAEAAARRAEATAEVRQREAEQARSAASHERALRQETEREVVAASELIKSLREERNAAIRQLKRVESDMAAQGAELRQVRHQIRMLEAELEQVLAEGGRTRRPAGKPAEEPPEAPLDRVALVRVIGDATEVASRLSAVLAAARGLLGTGPDVQAGGGSDPAATDTGSAPGRARPARSPVSLPPGVFDDSVDAAQHLVKVPDVLVLVDGYNVSQTAWPELPIVEQRQRLVDALTELNARCGAEVQVVFDGAATTAPRVPSGRGTVRVRFSPAGVEADDVVLDLVAATPVRRPVLVASSDGRVREGARRLGANVISARQLLSTLRR